MTRIGMAFVLLSTLAAPAHAHRMSVWVVPWDELSSASIRRHASSVDETNAVWFTLTEQGTIFTWPQADDYEWRASLSGTDVVPTIQNYLGGRWRGDIVAAIVNDPVRRQQHVDEIFNLVVSRGYSGIEIDYESLPESIRDNFTAFIHELANRLRTQGRRISVTVLARTETMSRSSSRAYDYERLGAAADTVKVQAYGFSWEGSAPGPISPLHWLEEVVRYAQKYVAHLVIAFPLYGYDWGPEGARNLEYVEAIALAQQKGVPITRDVNQEATFTYEGHTVYFQDAVSIRAKLEAILPRQQPIDGFAFWRAGGEDPDVWPLVREYAPLQTLVVNSAEDTNDGACQSYHCTFREALQAVNSGAISGSRDLIRFAIPGDGPHRIMVSGDELAPINDAVDIDGTSQPGYSGTPLIEIDGTNVRQRCCLSFYGDGLRILRGPVRIRGLSVINFPRHGITLLAPGNVIESSYIGLAADGTPAPNGGAGIFLEGSRVNRIGGFEAQHRNRIAANRGSGVVLDSSAIENAIIGSEIGGPSAALANAGNGVLSSGSTTAVLNSTLIGNTGSGYHATTGAQGSLIRGSVIRGNGGDGLTWLSQNGHKVLHSSITGNGGLAIDIGDDGVTPSPVAITAAVASGSLLKVTGTVTGITGNTMVQIFANASCDASGSGEAETLIDSFNVSSGGGSTSFQRSLALPAGTFLTATATAANTFEVSACRRICSPAQITWQPGSVFTTQDRSTTLRIGAGGTDLTYQWYIGERGDTSNPVAGATGTSITVAPAATTRYWARAQNSCGTADSEAAAVVVTAQRLAVWTHWACFQYASRTSAESHPGLQNGTALMVEMPYSDYPYVVIERWLCGTCVQYPQPLYSATVVTHMTPPGTNERLVKVPDGTALLVKRD